MYILFLLPVLTFATGTCYIDNVQHRQLNHQICEISGSCTFLSIESCAQSCRALNYTYAGVEAGHQCACGNTLTNKSANVDQSECNVPCTGNSKQTCGGNLRVWIYKQQGVPSPPPSPVAPVFDSRWIPNGNVLRSGGYSCQPYCSVLPHGVWSCVMTYIHAPQWIEGQPGEHLVSMRSKDQGKTWDEFVPIEPYSNVTTGQVSAYGSIAARQDGSRIFAIWIQNVNNVSHLPGQKPSLTFRADMLGNFVWKYSDDQGLTWSDSHYTIPVPYNYIETINSFSKSKNGTGDVQIMWQVDHMKTMKDNTLIFAFTKIGTYAVAPVEEIFILSSKNILTETDPTKVVWDMWPHGEHGIGAVNDFDSPTIITEEPHVLPIFNDDILYVVWRTNQGYMGHSQSKPGQKYSETWETSSFATYLSTWADNYENCSFVKNPRGPLSPKRQKNGLILMTYYNTAPLGAFASHMKVNDRNNMWLTVGHEIILKNGDKTVQWTQPELALYERDHTRGHGYPDVITDLDGQIYITETYKSKPQSEAKTHTINMELIDLLYKQTTINTTATKNMLFSLNKATIAFPKTDPSPLPNFMKYDKKRYGFTMDVFMKPISSAAAAAAAAAAAVGSTTATTLISALDDHHMTGMSIQYYNHNGTVTLTMQDDSMNVIQFGTDPICSKYLLDTMHLSHHIGVVVDGGPKMISFIVDGKLCDGGSDLQHWPNGHYLMDNQFGDISVGVSEMNVNLNVVDRGHYYNRALYTTEIIGNWRAGI